MQKEQILAYLRTAKTRYAKEGVVIEGLFGSYARGDANEGSDVDVLVHVTSAFAEHYGFSAIERLRHIQEEMSRELGIPVEFADESALGKTGQTFIVEQTQYV